MKKKIHSNNLIYTLIIFVLVICFIIKVPHFFKGNNDTLNYIKAEEQKDVTEVKETLNTLRKKELKKAIKSDEISVFDLFEDFVIYGDSRVYGYLRFFNNAYVFADAGNSIQNISDWDEKLKNINPSKVIIAYGINDLGLKLDEVYDGYKEYFEKMINEHILSYCPNAKIYINSIITASPEAMAKSPNWYDIDNYNKQIKEMCDKNHWNYIDNSDICDGTDPMTYTDDGIHFSDYFYKIWTQHMYEAMED